MQEQNHLTFQGEKLEENHVKKAVESSLKNSDATAEFFLFSPEINEASAFYTLFIEPSENLSEKQGVNILKNLEKALCMNFHYQYARDLGQLQPTKLFLISSGGLGSYTERALKMGQRLGDIKSLILDTKTGWHNYFKGDFFIESQASDLKIHNSFTLLNIH